MNNEKPEFILTINTGSILKSGLFDKTTLAPEISGESGGVRPADPYFTAKGENGKVIIRHVVKILNPAKRVLKCNSDLRPFYSIVMGNRWSTMPASAPTLMTEE